MLCKIYIEIHTHSCCCCCWQTREVLWLTPVRVWRPAREENVWGNPWQEYKACREERQESSHFLRNITNTVLPLRIMAEIWKAICVFLFLDASHIRIQPHSHQIWCRNENAEFPFNIQWDPPAVRLQGLPPVCPAGCTRLIFFVAAVSVCKSHVTAIWRQRDTGSHTTRHHTMGPVNYVRPSTAQPSQLWSHCLIWRECSPTLIISP